MTKETLKGFGLTDEQADKVMEALKGAFVTKARFDEVNAEKNQFKTSLTERDEQIEKLKTESGATDKLKTQIAELQTANQEKDKKHAAELKRLKREALDDRLLGEANAINTTAVRPFLTAIDESVDDEGYTAVRKQQIDALTKADSTKFLFKEADGTQTFTGTKPGESGTPPTCGVKNPFVKDTYDEAAQIELFRKNPELARSLARQAGISFI